MEPTTVTAGTTLTWAADYPDYPASAGWQLSYTLTDGTIALAIVWTTHVTASGDTFSISVPATATALWTARARGRLIGRVTKAGEVYSVYDASVDIVFAGQLSYAVRMLNAVEAMLLGNASREESRYSISSGGINKELEFCSKAELLKLRDTFVREVASERMDERIAQGLGTGRIIRHRYREAT